MSSPKVAKLKPANAYKPAFLDSPPKEQPPPRRASINKIIVTTPKLVSPIPPSSTVDHRYGNPPPPPPRRTQQRFADYPRPPSISKYDNEIVADEFGRYNYKEICRAMEAAPPAGRPTRRNSNINSASRTTHARSRSNWIPATSTSEEDDFLTASCHQRSTRRRPDETKTLENRRYNNFYL